MGLKPLVSVVTATYRNFDHLKETMRSVFQQDYPCIEYIITDDGSADFPADMVNELVEKEKPDHMDFKLILNPENVGTVKNLNGAYKAERGEYYINLSCGDVFFSKSVVSRIVERFLANDSDVVVTSRILYRGNFEPICLLPHYEEREIISRMETGFDQYKALITNQYYDMASGSAMSYSRRIMEEMNFFDEKYRLWEDGPFLAKYLQRGKLDCSYDIVSIWYEIGGVSTKKKGKKKSKSKSIFDRDTDLYNSGERLEQFENLSWIDRRKVQLKILQFKYKDSGIRHLISILHPIEYIDALIYVNRRKGRISKDREEIERLLSAADRN